MGGGSGAVGGRGGGGVREGVRGGGGRDGGGGGLGGRGQGGIRASHTFARDVLGGLRKKGASVEAERQVKEKFQAEAARMRTSAIALLLI